MYMYMFFKVRTCIVAPSYVQLSWIYCLTFSYQDVLPQQRNMLTSSRSALVFQGSSREYKDIFNLSLYH